MLFSRTPSPLPLVVSPQGAASAQEDLGLLLTTICGHSDAHWKLTGLGEASPGPDLPWSQRQLDVTGDRGTVRSGSSILGMALLARTRGRSRLRQLPQAGRGSPAWMLWGSRQEGYGLPAPVVASSPRAHLQAGVEAVRPPQRR